MQESAGSPAPDVDASRDVADRDASRNGRDSGRLLHARLLGPVRLSVGGALVVAALLALAGVALTLVVSSDVDAANARELAMSTWLVGLGDTWPLVHDLASIVSWLGDEHRTVPLVAFVATALLLARRPLWAGYLVVVTLGGVIVSSTVKATVGRPRPPLVEQPAGEELLSFPSGHTFAGVTVWLSLALIALAVLPPRWRGVVAVAAVTVGVMQGPSRLVLGRHWPTDVIGGWLLALAWLLLCLVATTLLARSLDRRTATTSVTT